MKRTLVALALLLAFAPVNSGAAKPINNMMDLPVPAKGDGSLFSLQEVQAIIVDGVSARGWVPTVAGEGIISATIIVRNKHYATVDIPFSSTAYSILYVSSTNLDYNEKRQSIHRNYNNWVVNLSRTINQKFSTAPQDAARPSQEASTDTTDVTSNSTQTDVYGELLKLDELRAKGILTEDEFEAEKRKLLDQN
jgi:hypothetical protein